MFSRANLRRDDLERVQVLADGLDGDGRHGGDVDAALQGIRRIRIRVVLEGRLTIWYKIFNCLLPVLLTVCIGEQ
jgi:hypothetical protein